MCALKFERGFDSVRKKAVKSSKYTRDCSNCRYYYQSDLDNEEVCQNSQVLEYDVCVDGNRVYCSYWLSVGDPVASKKTEKETKPSKTDWYKFERKR